jgi:hypothetical protein
VIFEIFDHGTGLVRDLFEGLSGETEPVAEDAAGDAQPIAPARPHNIEGEQRDIHEVCARAAARIGHHIAGLDRIRARSEPGAQLLNRSGIHASVCVEDNHRFEAALEDAAESAVQRVAFFSQVRVVTLDYCCAGLVSHPCSRVRAVVGDHEHLSARIAVDFALKVRQSLCDSAFFVVGRDDDRGARQPDRGTGDPPRR